MYNFDDVWCSTIGSILNSGTRVAPRGMETAELLHRTIAVDDNYLFTVTQRVENRTAAPVRLAPYGIIARHGQRSHSCHGLDVAPDKILID